MKWSSVPEIMTTSGCSTETERPHRRCKPLNKVKNIDRTRDISYTLLWAGDNLPNKKWKMPLPLGRSGPHLMHGSLVLSEFIYKNDVKDVEELWQRVEEEWDGFVQWSEWVAPHNRLKACIATDGGHFKHAH